MVEMEVEAIEMELGCMGASTHGMVNPLRLWRSIWLKWLVGRLGMVLRCKRLGRRCGPRRMRRRAPRGNEFILIKVIR